MESNLTRSFFVEFYDRVDSERIMKVACSSEISDLMLTEL